MASVADLLQPAGGGVAVIQPNGAPVGGGSPAPAPVATSAPRRVVAPTTVRRDFSKDYGLYQGTVYRKGDNYGVTSKDEFKSITGFSPDGAKFDTAYIPPSVLASQNINKPITSSELEKSINLPNVESYVTATQNMSLSDKVSAVAGSVLSSNQAILDQLYKDKESAIAAEKYFAEQDVKAGKDALGRIANSTEYQDTQKAIFDRLNVEENIRKYTDIQNKIVSAQEALNMGLIYEGDRPVRMQLILGRQASLQKQGLATIGALQGVASVIKGNVDLATAYAESTLNAIKEDNTRQYNALTTLLNLNQQKLVDLTDEERKIVDQRLDLIGTEIQQQEQDKNDVMDFMLKYPDAFLDGGVTLLDSKETALRKMLPRMAEKEKTLYNLEVQAKQKALKSGGSGSASGSQGDKALLLQYKSNGMTYDEAVLRFGDAVSIDYIASVYGRKPTGESTSAKDSIENAFYSQYLNPDGTIKTGTTLELDTKNGRINPSTEKQDSGGAKWWNPFSWF